MTAEHETGRVLIRSATSDDIDTLLEFRLAMMAAVAGAGESSPPQDTAATREANACWLQEHFGRDFLAWLAALAAQSWVRPGCCGFPIRRAQRAPVVARPTF